MLQTYFEASSVIAKLKQLTSHLLYFILYCMSFFTAFLGCTPSSDMNESYRKICFTQTVITISFHSNNTFPPVSKHILSCLTITNELLHLIEHMYSVDYTMTEAELC